MHPVIRVVSFMVLSLALAFGGWPPLLFGGLAAAVLSVRAGAAAWATLLPMMARMRWLWLSIAVIYFWFTPGTAVVPVSAAWTAWVPTTEGIVLGASRLAALALMVIMAGLLLHLTSREQIVAALHWLAAPLALFGIARERVAVRVALTLAVVAEVRGDMHAAASSIESQRSGWSRWGERVASAFRTTIARAEGEPCGEIVLPAHAAPPVWQWAWPIALGAVMLASTRLTQ